MDGLKQLLHRHPNISKVYLNEKGEYMLAPHSNFTIEKSREEILNNAIKSEPVATAEKPEQSISGNGKNKRR